MCATKTRVYCSGQYTVTALSRLHTAYKTLKVKDIKVTREPRKEYRLLILR